MNSSPTVTPESPLSSVMDRNMEALLAMRREAAIRRTPQERFIDAVTRFAGSMGFIYFQAIAILLWLLINSHRLHGVKVWDPYPYSMLGLVVSIEAIFLASFVLMGQKRQGIEENRRDELDLHINLLAEHEITRLVEMVEAISHHIGLVPDVDDLHELKRDVAPEAIVEQIQQRMEDADDE